MPFTVFLVWPAALIVLWIVERFDARTDQARDDLQRQTAMDKFDRAAAHLFNDDPFAELDTLWCADRDIDWNGVGVSALPLRRELPARPVKHSRNRLHRGFGI